VYHVVVNRCLVVTILRESADLSTYLGEWPIFTAFLPEAVYWNFPCQVFPTWGKWRGGFKLTHYQVFVHELSHLIWKISGIANEPQNMEMLENPLLKLWGKPRRSRYDGMLDKDGNPIGGRQTIGGGGLRSREEVNR
jgi:hypothetical protein